MKIQIYLSEEQTKEIVRQVLISLPVKDKEDIIRKAVLMRKKGLSMREIGKILNISRQTAWNYIKK